MELEGDHPDGDRINGGNTTTMERNQARSLIGQLGSGGGRVDGGSGMERGHKRPMLGWTYAAARWQAQSLPQELHVFVVGKVMEVHPTVIG